MPFLGTNLPDPISYTQLSRSPCDHTTLVRKVFLCCHSQVYWNTAKKGVRGRVTIIGTVSFRREFRERISVCTSGETDFDPPYIWILGTFAGWKIFPSVIYFTVVRKVSAWASLSQAPHRTRCFSRRKYFTVLYSQFLYLNVTSSVYVPELSPAQATFLRAPDYGSDKPHQLIYSLLYCFLTVYFDFFRHERWCRSLSRIGSRSFHSCSTCTG